MLEDSESAVEREGVPAKGEREIDDVSDVNEGGGGNGGKGGVRKDAAYH